MCQTGSIIHISLSPCLYIAHLDVKDTYSGVSIGGIRVSSQDIQIWVLIVPIDKCLKERYWLVPDE